MLLLTQMMLKALFASESDSESDSDGDCGHNEQTDDQSHGLKSLNNYNTLHSALDDSVIHTSLNGLYHILLKQEKFKGISHQLWPAAGFLCDYLESNLPSLIPPQNENSTSASNQSINVLELGAGVGLCGLFISKLPNLCGTSICKKVVVTDVLEAQEILNMNIDYNTDRVHNPVNDTATVVARELYWGRNDHVESVVYKEFYSPIPQDSVPSSSSPQINITNHSACTNHSQSLEEPSLSPSPPYLLIIASDCVYWECLFDPLFSTIIEIFNQVKRYGGQCSFIISHVKRWKKDNKFFAMCKKSPVLDIEVLHEKMDVVVESYDGSSRRRIQRIYRIQPKK